jgi:hypothetical protein
MARRDLLAASPGLARAIYTAFLAAKEAGAERYRQAGGSMRCRSWCSG